MGFLLACYDTYLDGLDRGMLIPFLSSPAVFFLLYRPLKMEEGAVLSQLLFWDSGVLLSSLHRSVPKFFFCLLSYALL